MQIFNCQQEPHEATILNLELDKGTQIKRFISTEKSHLVQLVFCRQDEYKQMFVMTWDLEKNLEFQMVELTIDNSENANLICRGMRKKFNYLVNDSHFYDFLYQLPLNYLWSKEPFANGLP